MSHILVRFHGPAHHLYLLQMAKNLFYGILMTMSKLVLTLMPEEFIICRLPIEGAGANIWLPSEGFWSLTRTLDEVSLVMAADNAVPMTATVEAGWRMLRVAGTLDFSLTGILAELSGILALAEVSIFALSTYDTDYLLVKAHQLERATQALSRAGIAVIPHQGADMVAATPNRSI